MLNLPSRLRITFGPMMLVGIIPGKSEPKNTDPYLDILVDELPALNNCVHYGYHNENFRLKAEVKLYYMDYPGQNKVFHCQGMLHPLYCDVFYVSFLGLHHVMWAGEGPKYIVT